MLAFEGIIFTLLAPKALGWFKEATSNNNVSSALLFIFGGALLTYSLFKIFRALVPQLNNVSTRRSLTFFGDIASMSLEDFSTSIKTASEEAITADLIQQVHVSARIASVKHENFKASVTLFVQGCVASCLGWMLLHLVVYVR